MKMNCPAPRARRLRCLSAQEKNPMSVGSSEAHKSCRVAVPMTSLGSTIMCCLCEVPSPHGKFLLARGGKAEPGCVVEGRVEPDAGLDIAPKVGPYNRIVRVLVVLPIPPNGNDAA